jgi:predicted nuclease of predicted toxin-antitoxin system
MHREILVKNNFSKRTYYVTSTKYKNVKLYIADKNYSDIEIWDYAKKNEYTIITFDSDFFDFANIKGHPPKIIWLRIGNTKTDFLAEILKEKYSIILDFIQSDNYSEIACLEIK